MDPKLLKIFGLEAIKEPIKDILGFGLPMNDVQKCLNIIGSKTIYLYCCDCKKIRKQEYVLYEDQFLCM